MTPEQWQRDAADLLFYVEHGYLVVQEPEETESWHRRKRLEELLGERPEVVYAQAYSEDATDVIAAVDEFKVEAA